MRKVTLISRKPPASATKNPTAARDTNMETRRMRSEKDKRAPLDKVQRALNAKADRLQIQGHIAARTQRKQAKRDAGPSPEHPRLPKRAR
jgi:hypothetical protein